MKVYEDATLSTLGISLVISISFASSELTLANVDFFSVSNRIPGELFSIIGDYTNDVGK